MFLSHAYFYLSFALIAVIGVAELTARRMKAASTVAGLEMSAGTSPQMAGPHGAYGRRPGMRGGLQVALDRSYPGPQLR
jgi:hypothetical protein